MHTMIVYVHIKEQFVDEFIEACRLNHEASTREDGNARFDILQQGNDPCRFVLYEAYADEASARAHKETEHYANWRETVAEWMASPREAVLYNGLYPEK